MKWFKNCKNEKEVKKIVVDKIDEEIRGESTSDATARDLADLLKIRREVKMNGVEPKEILAVVANVAIVLVMIGFEVSHILNQKGSRFIKVL